MKICMSCDGVAATAQERCANCDIPLLPTTAVHFPVRRGEVDTGNPLLGSVIDGKFLLQGVLGRGGMGTVFRACHAVSQVPVAVKLLHPRLSVRPEYRRGLLGEARKAGRVVHDQCARVLDVGETDEGTVYLAMELAEGETLDAWVRDGPLPTPVAIDVLTQIAQALVAIHAAGLVHRDLSSRNVMIALRDGAPVVKVLDFGIAQSVALAKTGEERAAGEIAFANPVFSAPEHLAGQEVDARADLYSFGVVAYLVLSGKLPIDQHDARAAARATVAGQLAPLVVRPGVPRRLVRLVQSCLSRDRAQRPQAAAEVLQQLQVLARGRLPWLPRVAVATFALAVVATLLTFARLTPPYLQLFGDRLRLSPRIDLAQAPVQYLTSRDLATVRASYGGFAADQLVVQVLRRGQLQNRQQLAPAVDRGNLVLAVAQAQWQQLIDGVRASSRDGPVELVFEVPGRGVLGSARVQIDDDPPELHCEAVQAGDDGRTLGKATRLRWQAVDLGELDECTLRVRLASGREFTHALSTRGGAAAELQLGELVRAQWTRVDALGPGELILSARDRAGNRAETAPLAFAQIDVDVPQVAQVTGVAGEPAGAIPFVDRRALVQVRLSAFELGLHFAVVDADGRDRLGEAVPRLDELGLGTLELRGTDDEPPFAPGGYRFVVTDQVGNRSEESFTLGFRSRSVDGRLQPDAEAAGVSCTRVGDELVLAAQAIAFDYTGNAAFTPRAARLSPSGNAPAPTADSVQLLAPAPGRARIALRELPPGAYELQLELEEAGGEGASTARFVERLRVLPAQLRLQLPDARARFLEPLRQAGLFAGDGDTLREGNFLIGAGLRRYLRGSVWCGSEPQALVPLPLPDQAGVGANLLPPVPLASGRNLLALDLRDVLGRPVAVTFADQPATKVRVGERELDLLADFWHDESPPQLVGEELRVEYEQSARVRVRTALPFREADRPALKLAVGGAEWPAAALRADGGGAELDFALPFAAWRDAAGFETLARDDYANGRTAVFTATLRSPAGAQPLRVPLRTARTTLRAVRLGELAARTLPAALAGITLVPILAPKGGTFADPVPADAPGRALYRPQPALPVRNFPDHFVQEGEFTLAQYAALLELLPTLTDRRGLVHADDPLGERRLTRAQLLPAAWRDRADDFAAVVAAKPAAAVTGVDFFQAFTAARLLARALGDDELVRLPFGCELELAAFGSEPRAGARSGVAAQGGHVSGERWRAAAVGDAETLPGPSAADCEAAGDRVVSPFGAAITGLDFGVREWVLDLPWPADLRNEPALPEWSSDHGTLSAKALAFARGVAAPDYMQARLRTFGVVRGLPLGARNGLLDERGAPLGDAAFGELPPSVPGVVRSEQLRRDGRDLQPGAIDPRLLRTGFRLVGGEPFVARVRGS